MCEATRCRGRSPTAARSSCSAPRDFKAGRSPGGPGCTSTPSASGAGGSPRSAGDDFERFPKCPDHGTEISRKIPSANGWIGRHFMSRLTRTGFDVDHVDPLHRPWPSHSDRWIDDETVSREKSRGHLPRVCRYGAPHVGNLPQPGQNRHESQESPFRCDRNAPSHVAGTSVRCRRILHMPVFSIPKSSFGNH